MSKPSKALIIIGALLITITAAYATWYYCEQWPLPMGSTASGYITYNNRDYYANSGSGSTWCREKQGPGNTDLFVSDSASWSAVFVWDSSGVKDTISLVKQDYLSHDNSGIKQTEQIGQKEGTGNWCGYDSNKVIYIWGTWNTGTSNDSYYFDYGVDGTKDPPTVSVLWYVSRSSDDENTTGSGTGSGSRASNVPYCFQ